MRAAVLRRLNAPLSIQEGIEIGEPGRGQVRVRLAYSGVCRSQLMEVRGGRGRDPWLPHLLGHEGTARVEVVGEGVTRVSPGDRVVLSWIKAAGLEAGGTRYRCHGETIHAGAVTTFNDQATVSENRCTRLPPGVPMSLGVLLGCALPTGAGIIINMLRPVAGSVILIIGVGGVGLSALLACRLYSFSRLIVVDVHDRKLRVARDLGATDTVDARISDPVAFVMEQTSGRGVDYAIEAAGSTRTIEQAFACVRKEGGLCVFASHPEAGSRIQLDPHELISGKRIEGSWGGQCDPDRDIPMFARLYLEGKLPLDRLVTQWYGLDQINDALDDLERSAVERPLVVLDPSLEEPIGAGG